MYAFDESTVITGDLATVWRIVSDVAAWPSWDPHVLESGFDATFEEGNGGWTLSRIVPERRSHFTLVSVEPGKAYTMRSPMPLGKMLIINRYAEAVLGRVEVSRRVEVHGGFGKVFEWKYANPFKEDTRSTFAALEKEAIRRAAQAGQP
jgi:hypothetical protein